MDSIGTRIKARRKELGLTQLQIKELTEISTGTLSDIENANALPSTPSLIKLSEVLDCSIDWILTGNSRSSETINNMNSQINEWINLYNQLSSEEQQHCLRFVKGYVEIGKSKV